MSKTFTYSFADGSNLTVTTADMSQQVDTGDATTHSGYAITNVSGTFNGQPVTGLFGTSGAYEQGAGGDVHDNAIFVSSTQGEGGSSYLGIDTNGIDFTLQNGNHINLFQSDNNQGAGATTLSYNSFTAQGTQGGNQNSSAPVTQSNYDIVTCFVTGTLIRVWRDRAEADVSVEALRVGDLAVTATGEHRPIRWIGHRTLDLRRHTNPALAQPIRISAHAFGNNRPARDLFVSPGHSICVNVLSEVLISAGLLINGATIEQVEMDEVTYWHVELEGGHNVILAENLAAESYLDMGNRGFFKEAEVVDLAVGPDADPAQRTHADFCRPFVDCGPILEAVRMLLRQRAETIGWRATDALDMHLLVDGQRLDPVVRDLTARFHVSATAKDVWLMSPTARPRDSVGGSDTRDLGLYIGGLRVDDGFAARDLAIDDPLLCIGFHAVEDGARRWTAGRARLPAALWEGCEGGFYLRIDLAGRPVPRWTAPAVEPVPIRRPTLVVAA